MAFLDNLLSLPRCAGLAVSPDGTRLVTAVQRVDAAGTGWNCSLWAIDVDGAAPPRRLTVSRAGETTAAFAPGGDLLFTSARPLPDPGHPGDEAGSGYGGGPSAGDGDEDDARPAGLWRLPAAGGEAQPVIAPPGGVDTVAVAAQRGTIVVAVDVHPTAADWEADRRIAEARAKSRTQAQLYTSYPGRYWDHWLGPRHRRLYVLDVDETGTVTPRDLTPDAGGALDLAEFAVAPDGRTVVTTWTDWPPDPRDRRTDLVRIDVATGRRDVLASGTRTDHAAPAFSPGGSHVVCVREAPADASGPGDHTLLVFDLETGAARDLLPDVDRWPRTPVFVDPDTVAYVADDHGDAPAFAVRLDRPGAPVRLSDTGTVTALAAAGAAGRLFALHDTVERPPRAVAVDVGGGDPVPLPTPGDDAATPGRARRVTTTAADGTTIGAWLVTPRRDDGADPDAPLPLVVKIHGGPLSSWTGWHWRWNPHVFVDRGYAVLLPDPALSTGYGLNMIRRGWGRWGEEPYTDLLALTDAAAALDEIDDERTAAIGGSFGGYMANWVAGHTDRFRAIVTHASLWDLRGFHGTTDVGPEWEREMGDPYVDPSRYEAASPHAHLANITTPVLVVHGSLDFRVPVSEALTLWTGLRRHGVEAQFLHFPDEHHWIQQPTNIRLWNETVLAFLDHHVRSEPLRVPPLLAGTDPEAARE